MNGEGGVLMRGVLAVMAGWAVGLVESFAFAAIASALITRELSAGERYVSTDMEVLFGVAIGAVIGGALAGNVSAYFAPSGRTWLRGLIAALLVWAVFAAAALNWGPSPALRQPLLFGGVSLSAIALGGVLGSRPKRTVASES